MFVPEKYEFQSAIRVGRNGGVVELFARDVDIHEDDRWVVFVVADGRATRVPRENISCVTGKWVENGKVAPPPFDNTVTTLKPKKK